MAETVAADSAAEAVKRLVKALGPVTATEAPGASPARTEAVPVNADRWTMANAFPTLPDWDFVIDAEDTPPASTAFGALPFTEPLFTIAHDKAPVAEFSGKLARTGAAKIHALLAPLLDQKPGAPLAFSGAIDPGKDGCPEFRLRAPLGGPAAFSRGFTLHEPELVLFSDGGDEPVLRVALTGKLRTDRGDGSALSHVRAYLGETAWRVEAARPPEDGRPGESGETLAEMLALLPLDDVRGGAAASPIADVETSLGGVLGRPDGRSPLSKVALDGFGLTLERSGSGWSVPRVMLRIQADVRAELCPSPRLALANPYISLDFDKALGIANPLIGIGGALQLGGKGEDRSAGAPRPIQLDLAAAFRPKQLKPRLSATLRQPGADPAKRADQREKPYSVGEILVAFGGAANPALDELRVPALWLDVATADWTIGFAAKVEGKLALPIGRFELRSGSLDFKRSSTDWSVKVAVALSLNADQGPLLELSGGYGKSAGLTLEGALLPIDKDKPATLEAVIQVADPSFKTTGVLRDIAIEELRATFHYGDSATWSFFGKVRWDLMIADQKVRLKAQLSVDKLSPDGKTAKELKDAAPKPPEKKLPAPDTTAAPAKLEPGKAKAGEGFKIGVEGTIELAKLKLVLGYDYAPQSRKISAKLALGDHKADHGRFSGVWEKTEPAPAAPGKKKDDPKDQITLKYERVKIGADGKPTAAAASITLGQLILEISEAMLGKGKGVSLEGAPWNTLGDIEIPAPELKIDLIKKSATLKANALPSGEARKIAIGGVEVGSITSISLALASKGGKKSLKFSVDGAFLGTTYSEESGNAIGWDLLDGKPPAVPGTGKLLDLRYAAVGQRISVSAVRAGEPIGTAIETLKAEMRAPTAEQRNKPALPVKYAAETGLFLAADLTVQDTVTIAAIYQLPDYAGISIKLAGKRAGVLAGLGFDLTYRRLGEVGVYSAAFQMPAKYRSLRFGLVGLTIGAIEVDIYTNSDFRVDLGFPRNNDFARSFELETPTLTGRGGFYFSKRSGSVAGTALSAANGRFDPVIAVGLGLEVGVVRQVSWGPVKGRVSLTVSVVLEGTYAPWWVGPSGKQIATEDYYYKFSGMAAISAVVDASVDFVVVSAKIHVEATARALMVMEAYEPTALKAQFKLAASAAVKIGWWTVDKSFSMNAEVDVSFGSRTLPPWQGLVKGGDSPAPPPAPPIVDHRGVTRPEPVAAKIYVAIVPSRSKDMIRSAVQNDVRRGAHFLFEMTLHGEGDVINFVLGTPVDDKGLGLILRELLDGALSDAFLSGGGNLRERIAQLQNHLGASRDTGEALERIANGRLRFEFESAPAQSSAVACAYVAIPPQLRILLLGELSVPQTIPVTASGQPESDAETMQLAFRDYLRLLLSQAAQTILTHWDALNPAADPIKDLRDLIARLGRERPGTPTLLASIGSAVSAMMLSGGRRKNVSISAAAATQLPLAAVERIWPSVGADAPLRLRVLRNGTGWMNLDESTLNGLSLDQIRRHIPRTAKPLFDPGAQKPLEARAEVPVSWSLAERCRWDEPAEGAIGPRAPAPAQGKAERHGVFVRSFPHSLVDAIELLDGYALKLSPMREGDPLPSDARLATLVPIEIGRGIGDEAVRLRGANGRDRDRLLALWRDLRDPAGPDLALTLLWLETPPGEAARFVSRQLDGVGTCIIQTNLSTITVGDRAITARDIEAGLQPDRAATASLVAAGLGQAGEFVRLAWKASVAGGDFVLRWMNADRTGLPPGLFGESETATIWLLALPRDGAPTPELRDYHNAIVGVEERASAPAVMFESESPVAPLWELPLLAPGEFGFSLTNPNPTFAMLGDDRERPNQELLAVSLFNILTARIPGAPPIPPIMPAARDKSWFYNVRLPVEYAVPQAMEQRRQWPGGALPDLASPYAAILAGHEIKIDLLPTDGFGSFWPDPPNEPVRVTPKYVDDLLAPDQWPGTTLRYRFEKAGEKPRLALTLDFALPNRTSPDDHAEDMERWRTIAYQLADPDMSAALRSSMGSNCLGEQQEEKLDPRTLRDFASAAYRYFCAQAALEVPTVVGSRGGTAMLDGAALPSIAGGVPILQVPAMVRFLTDYLNRPMREVFEHWVEVPRFDKGDVSERAGSYWAYFLHAPVTVPPGGQLASGEFLLREPLNQPVRRMLPFDKVVRITRNENDLALALNQSDGPAEGTRFIIDGRSFVAAATLGQTIDMLRKATPPIADPERRLGEALLEARTPVLATRIAVSRLPPIKEGQAFAELLRESGADPLAPQGNDCLSARWKRPPGSSFRGICDRGSEVPASQSETLADFLARHGITLTEFAAVNTQTRLHPELKCARARSIGKAPIFGDACFEARRGETLAQAAARLRTTPAQLIQANADLIDAPSWFEFVTLPDGSELGIRNGWTWNDVVWICAEAYGLRVSLAELAEANAARAFAPRMTPMLGIRPPPARLEFAASFRAETVSAIEEISCELVLRRPQKRVDKRYPKAGIAVAHAAPMMQSRPGKAPLDDFIDGFETALPGYRIAFGHRADGRARLFSIDRARAGLDAPTFAKALPCLSPPLDLGTGPVEASVRALAPGTGLLGDERFRMVPEAPAARDALAHMLDTIERLLTPELASKAIYYAGDALEKMVLAKWRFADHFADRLRAHAAKPGAAAAVPAPARERLRQALRRDLREASAIAAVLHYPVEMNSAWRPRPGDPLICMPVAQELPREGTTGLSLERLEEHFRAPGPAIADALADADGILMAGAVATYHGHTTTIRPGQRLRDLLSELGAPPPGEADAVDLRDMPALFRPGAKVPIDLIRITDAGTRTIRDLVLTTGLPLHRLVANLRTAKGIFRNPPDHFLLTGWKAVLALAEERDWFVSSELDPEKMRALGSAKDDPDGGAILLERLARQTLGIRGSGAIRLVKVGNELLTMPREEPASWTLPIWHRANARFGTIEALAAAMATLPLQIADAINLVRRPGVGFEALWDAARARDGRNQDAKGFAKAIADLPGILYRDGQLERSEGWSPPPTRPQAPPPRVRLTHDLTLRQVARRLGYADYAAFVEVITDPAQKAIVGTRALFDPGVAIPVECALIHETVTPGNRPKALRSVMDAQGVGGELLAHRLAGTNKWFGADPELGTVIADDLRLSLWVPRPRAPRLAGTLASRSADGAAVRIGTVKIDAVAGDTSFACPITTAALAEVAPGAPFTLSIGEIEMDISPVDDSGGYERSHWLQLARPIEFEVPRPAMAARPASPPSVRLVEQRIAAGDEGTGPRWTATTVAEVVPYGTQSLWFDLATNARSVPQRPDALEALCEWDALRGEIDSCLVALRAPKEGGTRLPDMLGTLASLVDRVANGWQSLPADTLATGLLIRMETVLGGWRLHLRWTPPGESGAACRLSVREAGGAWAKLASLSEQRETVVDVGWPAGKPVELSVDMGGMSLFGVQDATVSLSAWRNDAGTDRASAPVAGPWFTAQLQPSITASSPPVSLAAEGFAADINGLRTDGSRRPGSELRAATLFLDELVPGAHRLGPSFRRELSRVELAEKRPAEAADVQECSALRRDKPERLRCTLSIWSPSRAADAAPVIEYRDLSIG